MPPPDGAPPPAVAPPAEQQQQPRRAVRVRTLAPGDEQRWLQLFRAYIDFYGAAVPDAVVALAWQRLMADDPGEHQGYVAEDAASGEVLGLAHLLLHRSTWSGSHYCYLEDLFVDQQARGRGVGRALIDAVFAAAREQGADKVYWQTHEGNTAARALYDSVAGHKGFIVYEARC